MPVAGASRTRINLQDHEIRPHNPGKEATRHAADLAKFDNQEPVALPEVG